jgi:hypothetical protein
MDKIYGANVLKVCPVTEGIMALLNNIYEKPCISGRQLLCLFYDSENHKYPRKTTIDNRTIPSDFHVRSFL